MALAIGLSSAALIAEHIDWSWIFFINVPIGVIAIVAARLLIRESRDPSADSRLDIPGLLTSAVALFALTFALIEANRYGWTSPTILSLFAVAGIGMVAFVLLELHQRAPMLSLSLFRNGTFAGANIVALLVFLAMFGVFFFVSLYVQGILGYSPVQADAMFLPSAMLIMFVAPVAEAVRPSRLTLAHRRRNASAHSPSLLAVHAEGRLELLGHPARAHPRRPPGCR